MPGSDRARITNANHPIVTNKAVVWHTLSNLASEAGTFLFQSVPMHTIMTGARCPVWKYIVDDGGNIEHICVTVPFASQLHIPMTHMQVSITYGIRPV